MAGRISAALAAVLLLCLAAGSASARCLRGYGSGYGGGSSYGYAPAPAPIPAPAPVAAPVPAPAPAPVAAPAPRVINIAWALPGGAANNPPFANQTVAVGDQATFSFKGLHGLFKISDANCPAAFGDVAPLQQIMPPTQDGSATVTFDTPGVYWFACPVAGHCDAGMKIKFTAS